MNQVFQQDLNTKELQPGGPLLINLLFKEPVELPDTQRVADVCRKHFGNVECREGDDKSVFITALDHMVEFEDGKAPVQFLMTSCMDFDGKMGISSGASLGVALVVLAGVGSSIGIAGAAWLGAAVVLLVIAAVGHRIKDIMVILILGMMFSSGVSAVVQILQYLSKEEALKAFVIWTMGSLGDVTVPQLAILLPSVIVGLLLAVWTIKPLNLLLFGEEYAVTMGLNIRRSRGLLFLSTTLLAGTVTAFCGPIGFIGLAMPHVARMLFREADHRVLLPGTLLSGAAVLLLCDIVSKMFTLPVNAITALLGIPIVVWVVLRNKSMTV